MEEERWERISGPGVDDHAAEPPPYAWGPDEQAVDGGNRNREGIMPYRAGVCGCCWGWGDEVGLFWGRVTFREVDFDVCVEGISEGVFGEPGEKEGGGYFRFRGSGRGGCRSRVWWGFLLQESNVAWYIVFRRWSRVDVDLKMLSAHAAAKRPRTPIALSDVWQDFDLPCFWSIVA